MTPPSDRPPEGSGQDRRGRSAKEDEKLHPGGSRAPDWSRAQTREDLGAAHTPEPLTGAPRETGDRGRLAPGDQLAGRYRIVSSLGSGGMGEVYRADDLTLGQPVALKFLHRDRGRGDGTRLQALLNEVRLSRQITHPNVCRVYDLGEVDGLHFLSMEYIDGEDLASLLRRIGRLPRDKALEIGVQVCDALAAAHDLGILHRDLKPANLMIDSQGRARITDFGLAALSDTVSGAAVRSGTPAYMAPEQAVGRDVTLQSDLYSLGLVLVELLTGRKALDALAPETHEEADPVPDEERPADPLWGLEPAARRIILRCLEANPDDRPRSAREVGQALAPGGGLSEGTRVATLVLLQLELARDRRLGRDPTSGDWSPRLDDLLGEISERHQGREVESSAGSLILFERPSSAVSFTLAYHPALAELAAECGAELAARCGLHLGEVQLRHIEAEIEGAGTLEAIGEAMSTVSGLTRLASPGQTLLTRAAFDLARRGEEGVDDSERLRWLAHGEYLFRDLEGPLEIFEVGLDGESPLEAPRDSEAAHRAEGQATILGWRPAPSLPMPHRPNWEVVRKLGEGGFGEVWLAKHTKTHEQRVFKFCYEAEHLQSLQREVTVLRLLKEELGDRQDIVRVLDWNLEESPYFIELAYTEAGSLQDWTEAQGGAAQVPLPVRLEIVAQVATALSAAHSVGVLHKDVKPANVLIHEISEGRPQAALTDFGIGTITDRERLAARGITVKGLTELHSGEATETTTGTQLYRAPELLAGEPATIQADIYALGVTLYQLVVGDLRRPLAPGWERHVEDELLREDIASFVDGTPARRPRSALEVAELLRTHEQRKQERQRRREAALKAERAQRRRRLLAVLAAVSSVFLVVVSVLALQAHRARQDAERRSAQAEQLIDFMLTDLHDGLERIGRLDLLDQVSRSSQSYFDSLTESDESGDAVSQRGQTLINIGDVLLDGGDAEEALRSYRSALELFAAAAEGDPARAELIEGLSSSRVRFGSVLALQGRGEEALEQLEQGLQEATALLASYPHDNDLRYISARARYEIAEAQRRIGNRDAAFPRLREALEAASKLIAAEADPHWRHWLLELDTQIALADLLRYRGDFGEALQHLEAAQRTASRLASEDPGNASWERELAAVHQSMGIARFVQADWPGAIEALVAARDGYRRLARADPTRVEWPLQLGAVLTTLGAVHGDRGAPQEALAPYTEALQILQRLVSSDPTRLDLRESLARLHQAMADAHLGVNAPAVALQSAEMAHSLRAEIADETGDDPDPLNELAWSHVVQGNIHVQMDDLQGARQQWTLAVEIIEPVTTRIREPMYLDTHAQALLKLGRLEEARPLVEELLAAGWGDVLFMDALRASGLDVGAP